MPMSRLGFPPPSMCTSIGRHAPVTVKGGKPGQGTTFPDGGILGGWMGRRERSRRLLIQEGLWQRSTPTTHFVSSFWAVLVPSRWSSRSSCFCVNLSRWSNQPFPDAHEYHQRGRPARSRARVQHHRPRRSFIATPSPIGQSTTISTGYVIGAGSVCAGSAIIPATLNSDLGLLVVALVIATGWAAFIDRRLVCGAARCARHVDK